MNPYLASYGHYPSHLEQAELTTPLYMMKSPRKRI
jgi:hypothetical protein